MPAVAAIHPVPALSHMTALAMPLPPQRPFAEGVIMAPTTAMRRPASVIPAEVLASPLRSSAVSAPVPSQRPITPEIPAEPSGALAEPVPVEAALVTGSIAPPRPASGSSLPPEPSSRPPARLGVIRLEDAVARAVLTYPEIRINQTRLLESKAGIDIARSALYPSADARLAAGGNFSGSYEGKAVPYNVASNAGDNRFDGGIILRQLVWDFGAARADIARARLLSNAEQERLYEKIDEIAWRTAQVYLKILEHRALVSLIDETIAAHMRLLKIVAAQEAEGHGTSADSSRIRSRLNDITAVRSDVSLQLGGAEDQFERLTRQRAGRLIAVPDFRASIPARPEAAISVVLAKNPRLASLRATTQSIESELDAQRASNKPKFMFELDTESKNFRSGKGGRTQIEGRAMLAMRFRLLDGGLAEAQERQIRNRIETSELTMINERQQLEADLRQAYRAIDSAGAKARLLDEGASAARRAEELYLEQFKAGKRTVFELLDGQMAVYTARRAQIESRFERQKAVIDILRYTGALASVLAGKDKAPASVAAATKQ
ncbi:MAG: TolC family protein [Beijerinckiaceae bacterium]|nr:TolC family protein [Beijerinckiaceae bacterium]MCZ8299086.1 TolC family protein [Beijerinckiaceae bacterium]